MRRDEDDYDEFGDKNNNHMSSLPNGGGEKIYDRHNDLTLMYAFTNPNSNFSTNNSDSSPSNSYSYSELSENPSLIVNEMGKT